MIYRLLHEEGLYMGASSALNVVSAYQLAKKLGPGKFSLAPPILLQTQHLR